MQAATDLLPSEIEMIRSRRRSVELRLEEGRLRARVPLRISRKELDAILPELRQRLWEGLARKRVFDQRRLSELAKKLAQSLLRDLELPPFTVCFSRRQRRRWGSCTHDPLQHSGSIRISDALRGHPTWVVEHILLHELIHLRVPDHGARFAELMRRSAHYERAEGYLAALESLNVLGGGPSDTHELLTRVVAKVKAEAEGVEGALQATTPTTWEALPLFASRPSEGTAPRTSSSHSRQD